MIFPSLLFESYVDVSDGFPKICNSVGGECSTQDFFSIFLISLTL